MGDAASQITVSNPVRMKAHRQPSVTAMTGTTSGVRIAPTLDPALKMPMASARSFFGNHSFVAAIAAGKVPASPIASGMRASNIPAVEVKKMCATCPMVQSETASA